MLKFVQTAFVLLGVSFVVPLSGQQHATLLAPCHTDQTLKQDLQQHPVLASLIEKSKAKQAQQETSIQVKAGTVYTIPVVFHVIHDNGAENVSSELLHESIDRLNLDFNALNADFADVNTAFAPIAADVELEFALAQKDPDGNCHSGINRIQSNLTYVGDDVMQSLIQWPRHMYLNIWICENANGAAAYARFPSTVDNNLFAHLDGIVCGYQYLGIHDRTLTHEVGHWLDLPHVWGNTEVGLTSNCNLDDGISDTPNTMGNSFTCDTTIVQCGSLDNTQNYMDYSWCTSMFTEGQKTRMRTALTSNVAQRFALSTPDNLLATGVLDDPILCQANFQANRLQICVGDSIQFSDLSFNGVTSHVWSFPGGQTSNTTSPNPIVAYNAPGVYPVTLEVSDGTNSTSKTIDDYIRVLPLVGETAPFSEGFEGITTLDPFEWQVVNDNVGSTAWELTGDASYGGSQALTIQNYQSPEGETDYFVSNAIDVTTLSEIKLSFRYAFAPRFGNITEKLRVEVSNNCGETWSLRKQLQGNSFPTSTTSSSPFVPDNPGAWKYVLIENIVPSFAAENFMFRFNFTSGTGNNLYIDDINLAAVPVGIDETFKRDLQFSVAPNPVADGTQVKFTLNNPEPVKLEVVDLLGHSLETLTAQQLPAGTHVFDLNKVQLSTGIYLVHLQTSQGILTERIVVQ